jgi:hypothetical protein
VDAYTFTVTSACGERNGLGTYDITVTQGHTTVKAHDRHSGPTTVRSIEDLFGQITQAQLAFADRVDVTYNQQLGYPEQIDIDYFTQGIDDEECYAVTGLRTL